MGKLSLSRLLRHDQKKPKESKIELEDEIKKLQLGMLRVQQGMWHSKGRAILAFEGFDAAGKGGCIRTVTELLDPRSVSVHPIGPPEPDEQARHWLFRFWRDIPKPGIIAVFDRTWYGRVLAEKVEHLAPAERIRQAYHEINEFERQLEDDGVVIVKFFLAVSKDEQLKRFEERLKDPYKQWKLTEADIEARRKWDEYVEAADKIFARTGDWNLIPADHKHAARRAVLEKTISKLGRWGKWMDKRAAVTGVRSLKDELRKLGKKEKELK